jgi:hypothetical protein
MSATNDSGGYGVWARGSPAGYFESNRGLAVEAVGTADTDVIGATSSSPNHAVVSATNNAGGYALWASSPSLAGNGGVGIYAKGAKHAAELDGAVLVNGQLTVVKDSTVPHAISVTGDINVNGDVVLSGADCAEEFDIATADEIDCGTVMVLTENGFLQPSREAYDKKVAGVISGGGAYRPGLILDRRPSSKDRLPLALVGKVYCKVDAQYGPVDIGDLLSPSPTPGHAMRASDTLKAFGAVIGKALRRLEVGQAQIPILVALQ